MTSTIDHDAAFQAALVNVMPQMRAFAGRLCRHPAQAEDLAQEATARAWASRASFHIGSNMRAWTFMILRNQFYSDKRRSWRLSELDPDVAEQTLVAVTHATATFELDDLRRAIATLPEEQRQALLLVGASGLSYAEAAPICGVAIGTVKSRVSRARERLSALCAKGGITHDGAPPSGAMGSLLSQMNRYQTGLAA
jgi:RNA polymerase sigma-70 factor (ECF subfamily)